MFAVYSNVPLSLRIPLLVVQLSIQCAKSILFSFVFRCQIEKEFSTEKNEIVAMSELGKVVFLDRTLGLDW